VDVKRVQDLHHDFEGCVLLSLPLPRGAVRILNSWAAHFVTLRSSNKLNEVRDGVSVCGYL
jgi:hypothetical protein